MFSFPRYVDYSKIDRNMKSFGIVSAVSAVSVKNPQQDVVNM